MRAIISKLVHFGSWIAAVATVLATAYGVAIVADGNAGRIDAARQSRFRNDPPVPNSRQQVVPAHHAVAVSNQELQ